MQCLTYSPGRWIENFIDGGAEAPVAAGGLLEAEGIMLADIAVPKAITAPSPRRSAAQRKSTRKVASGKLQFHVFAALAEFGRNLICVVCALMCLFPGECGLSPLWP